MAKSTFWDFPIGIKKSLLDKMGFTAAHKAGLTGKGINVVISDDHIYEEHPALGGRIKLVHNIQKAPILNLGSVEQESPNVWGKAMHGVYVSGECAADPSFNPESYGAAYNATFYGINFPKGNGFPRTPSDALEDAKKEVKEWINSEAKVINLSRSIEDLAKLTEDKEGKELLDHLFTKNDPILVIGAGNGKKIVSFSQFKISDEGEKVFYSPYQVSEKLKPYVDHIVYVGALHPNDKKSVIDNTKLQVKAISNLSEDNLSEVLDLGDLAYVFKLANQSLVDFSSEIEKIRFSKCRPEEKNQKAKELLLNIISTTEDEFVKKYLNTLLNKAEEEEQSLAKELFSILSDGSGENRPPFDSDKEFIFDETYSNLAGNKPNFICAPCAINFNVTGTSFAAPVITAALILARQKYPDLSGPELIKKLLATADHVPGLEYWYGEGNLNLFKFLELPDDVPSIEVVGDSVYN